MAFCNSFIPQRGHDRIKTSPKSERYVVTCINVTCVTSTRKKIRNSSVSRCSANVVYIRSYINGTSADTRVGWFFLFKLRMVRLRKSEHIVLRYGAQSWPLCNMKVWHLNVHKGYKINHTLHLKTSNIISDRNKNRRLNCYSTTDTLDKQTCLYKNISATSALFRSRINCHEFCQHDTILLGAEKENEFANWQYWLGFLDTCWKLCC